MTEREWLSSTNTLSMIEYVLSRQRPVGRKNTLFGCACCRLAWHLLSDTGRAIVREFECDADGQAMDHNVLARLHRTNARGHPLALPAAGGRQAAEAVSYLSWPWVPLSQTGTADIPEETHARIVTLQVALTVADALTVTDSWEKVRGSPAELVREVYGNPFRPVKVNPSWRTWNGGTVVKIADAIYEDRAFDRMPILGDALEESGCDDESVLTRCREPRTHVRGCWVLDAMLGKT